MVIPCMQAYSKRENTGAVCAFMACTTPAGQPLPIASTRHAHGRLPEGLTHSRRLLSIHSCMQRQMVLEQGGAARLHGLYLTVQPKSIAANSLGMAI